MIEVTPRSANPWVYSMLPFGSPRSRRQFLAASILAVSDVFLTSCRHGMQVLKTGSLRTPPSVPTDSRLTIDVHAHIFNGTDLQIEKFLGDVTFSNWWAKAAGEILQLVNWGLAPTGDEEKGELDKLVRVCQLERSSTRVSTGTGQILTLHRADGYRRARQAVLDVQQRESSAIAAQGASRSIQDAKEQIYTAFATPNFETLQQHLNIPPPLTENMNREIISQHSASAGRPPNAMAASSEGAQAYALKAAVKFITQYFQYRFVSAQDYLDILTPGAARDVDLILVSMVDYDWWLAHGDHPPTTLETQIEVAKLISILSDGRVHGFAPFCPLREVAARAGLKNSKGGITNSSLALVQNAVRLQGCIGVKLYPPMGFAPYGNAFLDDPQKGGNANFWKGGLLPNWTSEAIRYPDGTLRLLGQRLDDALDDLYAWCADEQVPILAHTEETNGPDNKYKLLASATYWALALSKYPRLRVNFGHLGGLDDSISSVNLPDTAKAYVTMLGAESSTNAYGDTAFSSNIILNQGNFSERIQVSYQQGAVGTNKIPSHLMYGSDWSLLEIVGNNEVYMQRFVQLLDRIPGTGCSTHSSAADCFFGLNAAEFLGLRPGLPGKSTRSRLERFYSRNCMPEPVWMKKLAQI